MISQRWSERLLNNEKYRAIPYFGSSLYLLYVLVCFFLFYFTFTLVYNYYLYYFHVHIFFTTKLLDFQTTSTNANSVYTSYSVNFTQRWLKIAVSKSVTIRMALYTCSLYKSTCPLFIGRSPSGVLILTSGLSMKCAEYRPLALAGTIYVIHRYTRVWTYSILYCRVPVGPIGDVHGAHTCAMIPARRRTSCYLRSRSNRTCGYRRDNFLAKSTNPRISFLGKENNSRDR